MKRLRFALLFSISLAVGACTADTANYPPIRPVQMGGTELAPFDKAYQGGKGQLAAGRVGLALVAFEKALAIDPLSVAALNAIGAAYDGLRRYDLAQAYYRRALLLEPDGADTLNNIAVSMQLAGNADAREWFGRAAKLDPSNEIIMTNIAQLQADDLAVPEKRLRLADILQDESDDLVGDTRPRIERSGMSEYKLQIPLHPVDVGRVLRLVPTMAMPPAPSRIEVQALDAVFPAPSEP